ncbi:hypothetical protein AVEN_207817-1 [Araneus ventricosus]|uniref:Uncharacterized protein n=1 Tax=Araneus ventricosus TaxID=182803 RepID=A0A4Y2BYL8_ARAVE|nr:hypothetical protein AVEN_207817-1 [Araneus ventricosus]
MDSDKFSEKFSTTPSLQQEKKGIDSWDKVVKGLIAVVKVQISERNPSFGQYLPVHKDSFSNPPTNRRLDEAVVVDWPKMMRFEDS